MRGPPRYTRSDLLVPYTTLFRSGGLRGSRATATATSATSSRRVLATAAGCATASTRRRCASFREKRWKPKATATTSTKSGVRHEHRARDAGRRLLLGRAGIAAEDAGCGFHARRLQRRRRAKRHLSQPRHEIGRAHVCTPVTNAHLVCRLLLEKKKHN